MLKVIPLLAVIVKFPLETRALSTFIVEPLELRTKLPAEDCSHEEYVDAALNMLTNTAPFDIGYGVLHLARIYLPRKPKIIEIGQKLGKN